ncbi:ABC transporter ATP-binding protein [Ancylobacter sp. Lp-2]|uniref:ABC transporter ATP-binding protein n=1 Tax=Ancylobacter sp. Lp-2 TaxID=2881339 RepID=UPI001E456890|nr:ABC transporter ATP-binding protein [Ancylobacter sp. Lp-2]MCB4768589.1 ABC transporter ATP-binding protein [Ancylobacter sp. Lp-2]
MNGSAPLLEIKGLHVEAVLPNGGIATILDDISLTLGRGEVMGLIGESGAGKSTLGLTALGAVRGGAYVRSGEVKLDGVDLLKGGPALLRDIRGRRVAYVAQSAASAFNPAFRLIDQVIETSVQRRLMSRAQARQRAIELFARLELPSPETFGEKFPHQASGGQLQRAMTAMAMCARPDLIVFDEPTTALDVTTQIEVILAVRQAIREEGMAGLYISHDLALVAQMADAILVLRHGKMVESGSTAQVIEAPTADYTRRLIAARNLRHAPQPERPPLLELKGIAAGYGNVSIIEKLDLVVPQGRTLAVVGESGSGKSTLGKVICGLLPHRAGSLAFAGRRLEPDMHRRPLDDLRDIQMVHQNPDLALNPRQRVGEIIGAPLSRFQGLRGAARDVAVAALLEQVELKPEFAERRPGALSGGQKQRVCIARALAARPRLIVCDEVTSALDPLVADGVLKLLARLQAEQGVSYLFITHDFGAVEALADHVAVMRHGALVAAGPARQVLNPPYHPYTEALIRAVPELRLGWLDGVIAARATQTPDRRST